MPTTALPRGRKTRNRLVFETTFKVNPGSGTTEFHAYALTIKPNRPLVDDDVIGAGYANSVDSRPAAPSVSDPTVSLSVPLDIGQIGWWLGGALGRVSASGSTVKTHVFTTGNEVLPTMSLEQEFAAASQYAGAGGVTIKSLKFNFGPGPGYQQVDIEAMAGTYIEPYNATAMGSPTVETLVARAAKSVGSVSLGGTQAGDIISGDVTVSNDLAGERYLGDGADVSQIAIDGGVSVAVNVSARFRTDTLRTLGNVGAGVVPPVGNVSINYVVGANLTLTLFMPNVRWEPVAAPVTNGKSVTMSLTGRAELDATNPALTATLVNGHASY
jgi:Phage tail tube protein